MPDAGRPATPAENDEFMTIEEFAALPADAHHAIWKAAAEGRLDFFHVRSSTASARRYHRRQAREILARTAAA